MNASWWMVDYTYTCACTYTCTYTCTHICTYIHISINTSKDRSISTYTLASTQKSAHIQIHLYIHLYVYDDDTSCVRPLSGQPPSRDPDSVGAFSCSRVADPLKMKKIRKIRDAFCLPAQWSRTVSGLLHSLDELCRGFLHAPSCKCRSASGFLHPQRWILPTVSGSLHSPS